MEPILPGATIGMLGGGQLGRMFALAAAQLGYRVTVYCDDADSPAATVAAETVVGSLGDHDKLREFASRCDVVTLEFENLDVEAVSYLDSLVPVYPKPHVLRIAQDRRFEKQTFADAGLKVTPFRVVMNHEDLRRAIADLGLPVVLKTARDGYDGKGQWKLTSQDEATLGQLVIDRPMIAEAWITHQREVSVVVARGQDGHVVSYPVFENIHRNHILDVTTCPASISATEEAAARALAIAAAEAIDLVGLMCVELFQATNGTFMINEVAPRPHNSGHLTIEACHTSQFEQQLRVVCGLPLGDTALRCSAAAMVNLMGDLWQQGEPDWAQLLAEPGFHLHLYDKDQAAVGRKMGHLTALGEDAAEVAEKLVSQRERISHSRADKLSTL